MKKIFTISAILLSISLSILVVQSFSWANEKNHFASCNSLLPSAGGSGICNNNADTITLGGPIQTSGSFSLAGAYPLTLNISGNSNIGLPLSGNLISDSGSYVNPDWITSLAGSKLTGTVTANAITAGTYAINISGNAGSANTVTTNADLTGDVSSVGNATTLATVNSNTGTFGNSNNVASVTLDAKGRVIAAANVPIAGIAPSGPASGDLSNNYPSPSVSKINGVSLGATTATSGNILIGNGSQWVTNPISGDGTLSSTGGLLVTKTNGVNFSPSATTDATNAANISSGILPSGRLNGTYNSAISGAANSIATTSTTGNADFYPAFVSAAFSGNQVPFVNSSLFYRPSTGTLSATNFNGTLIGNASTASALTPGATINGTAFTGASNITISASPNGAAGGDLTGTYPNPTLASVITAGSAGSASVVPAITFDAKGRLTTVTPTTITPAAIGAPTTSGSGATGDWGINISGNSAAATNILGGALGSIPYQSALNSTSFLAGNTLTTRKFLRETGTGSTANAPVFDTLLASDIPASALTANNDTNVTLTLGGTPASALLNGASITAGWTGTLAAARLNSNVVQSVTNDTNITGSIAAQNLTLGWTGALAASRINFNATNLQNSAGALNTIQNIATTSSPTFASELLGNAALVGTNSALQFQNALAAGDYINLGTNGRNIGVVNGGNLFLTYNLDYNATTPGFEYATSNPGGAIQLRTTGGGSLQYVPTGVAGASVTPSSALSWDTSGNVNLPSLAASSLVATDAAKNLTSTVSNLSPTFSGLTLSKTGVTVQQINTTTAGISNGANLYLNRGDTANGISFVCNQTSNTFNWCGGLNNGATDYILRDMANNVNVMTAVQGATNTSTVTFAGKVTAGNDITTNNGDVIANTAGRTIRIRRGTNACSGTGVTLVSGTATVSTTCAQTGDIVILNKTTAAGAGSNSMPATSITNNVSFTITSANNDSSTYAWIIIKAAI